MNERGPGDILNSPFQQTAPSGFRTLIRYVAAIRKRIVMLLLCVAVCCSIGLLYFLLSPRVYEARAEVLIGTITRDDRLLVSEPVMVDAVRRLKQADVTQFEGVPEQEQAEYLRSRLIVRKPGGRPDILQLRYRCDDPQLASESLNAIVLSFMSYMGFEERVSDDGTLKDGVASKLLTKLFESKSDLEKAMARKRAELFLQMQRVSGARDALVPGGKSGNGKKGLPGIKKDPVEPFRLFPEEGSPLKKVGAILGKTPEEINRLQVLAYENRMLGMLRALIEDLSESAEEAKESQARVEVIQKATPPLLPVVPRPLTHILVMSLVVGFTLGFAVVFVLESIDDHCRSRAELSYLLDAPVLGSLGQAGLTAGAKRGVSESECQSLGIAIDSVLGHDSCVVVASVDSAEGHALVARRLAATYSRNGSRVLLIQAAPRYLKSEPGLSTILASSDGIAGSFAGAVCRSGGSEGDAFDTLPFGSFSGVFTALVASEKMSELLRLAISEYDRVVIDVPSAEGAIDAAVIGRLADGVLLFVQPETDTRTQLVCAREEMQLHGCRVWGAVVDQDQVRASWSQGGLGLVSPLRDEAALIGSSSIQHRRGQADAPAISPVVMPTDFDADERGRTAA